MKRQMEHIKLESKKLKDLEESVLESEANLEAQAEAGFFRQANLFESAKKEEKESKSKIAAALEPEEKTIKVPDKKAIAAEKDKKKTSPPAPPVKISKPAKGPTGPSKAEL